MRPTAAEALAQLRGGDNAPRPSAAAALAALRGEVPDFADVSGGASSASNSDQPAAIGGGYGILSRLGQKAVNTVRDLAADPVTAIDRGVDAFGFGLPRRMDAAATAAGNRVADLVDDQDRPGYDQIRAQQEAQRADYKQAHPEAATVADVTGSLVGGVGAASKIGGGLLRQAVGNAAIAGGQTLGDSGDLDKAKTDAVVGGGLTLALGATGKVVRSLFSPKTAAEETGAILDDIASRAGVSREPVEQAATRMSTARKAATSADYAASANDVVPINAKMRDVLRDPLFRQAHDRAEALAAKEGKMFTPLYDADGNVLGDAPIATLQSMKQRVSEVLKEAKAGMAGPAKAGTSQTFSAAEEAATKQQRRTLMTEAGKHSPAFARAEAKYAELSKPIGALRRGERFLNKGAYPDAAAIERDLARLTPEAQSGFRQGALEALKRQADRQVETVTGYRRLLKNTDLQDRVTAILPASERQSFRNMVERQGIWDAIRRLQNAPFLNAVKPVTSTVQAGRILGKQAGLGRAGAAVESTARLGGGELARFLAEAMRE